MKTPASLRSMPSVRRSFFLSFRIGRGLLLASGLGLLLPVAHAQDINIGIRSTVVDKPFGKGPAPVHGKIYGMLPPQLVPSEERTVKPVDTNLLAALVARELDAHGFRRVAKGQTPEIVISMYYGRGWLRNPYMAGAGPETPGSLSSVGGVDAPTVSITGTGEQLFKEMGPGYEAKLQKAGYEKLFIRVTAWEYPKDAKSRPKMLWHTTMVADDPDHRDLNSIASEMIKQGANFFDKEIKEEEVDLYKPVPEGRVRVGTPEVVEPTPAPANQK